MKVFLTSDKKITKYQLPSKIDDTFLITYYLLEKEYSILLENRNNEMYLKSNGNADVVVNDKIENFVKIEFYKKYNIKLVGVNKFVEAYFLPNNDKLFKVNFANLDNLIIGKDNICHIQYQTEDICSVVATIKFMNNEWYISCVTDEKYKVFINNLRCKIRKLKVGDIIFTCGLKIVWMGNFICVNNPLGLLKLTLLTLINETEPKSLEIKPVSEDEKSIGLYEKNEYFSHYPKIKEKIKEKEIFIDSPPGTEKQDNLPWYLTIGSTIIMVSSSFIMAYNVIYGISNDRPLMSLIPQIIMCIAMIVGSIIIPKISKNYTNKKKEEREKLRQEKYSKYLSIKEKEIIDSLNEEQRILNDNYLNIDLCLAALKNKNKDFWSYRFEDEEFLSLRLGLGTAVPHLEIHAPEEHFSLDSDNLLEYIYSIKKKYKTLDKVPVTVSLKNNNIVSLICYAENSEKYINNLLTQIIALQSSMDLKIIIMTNDDNSEKWEFAKYIPHIFSNDKSIRFFVANDEDAKNVSSYLEDVIKERQEDANNENLKLIPYYLIITDDYKNKKNVKIIDDIVNGKMDNLGISLLVLETTMKQVPLTCETFIEIGAKEGTLIEKQAGLNHQKIFDIIDSIKDIDMLSISRHLANVPVMEKNGPTVLPTSISFLEMYKVSKIEQLNILNRWQTNNPVMSLDAIVGVHSNSDRFKLDLHEKYHGPHGLIAGMTGSGKSEFIITYILSMALSYHPYEVQFVLVDYKGGGLAGAFENKETGVKIPHLVGTITNLDISEMNRSLVSIQSELTKRQRIFNETREKLNEGTIDIYKYQKLYREGVVKNPMSHLFIICDEFAELKQQRPEFIQSLISISRIGRSLGIHLILATQKPSGLVNDQIWANSKFKVCLKVQDRSDSMEMLKRPEAASIKETGRFYLQVGYDDLFEIGQSGWSGAKYNPSDKILLKYDETINFINNVGYVVKSAKDVTDNEIVKKDYGEELTNLVKYIFDLSIKENIETSRLWLDPIPDVIYIPNLKNKYNYKPKSYYINPLIGEFDDPINQIQGLLNVDLSKNGNLLIYGASGSGKENLLTTLIYSIIVEHTPDETNIYILDCGSESLKIFGSMPHVGDVITLSDSEKIKDLFEYANNELELRKDLFADYAGNYNDYILNSGKKLPIKIFIINNYDAFSDNYSNYAERIQFLFRDGAKYGIIFIISAINSNAIRMKSLQFFENRICLQMGNNEDYRNILNLSKQVSVPNKFGRGLIKCKENVYEFQTAYFCDKKDITNKLRELSALLNKSYTTKVGKIPSIPTLVTFDKVINYLDDDIILPIGYSIKTKDVYNFNFGSESFITISANMINDEKMSFIFAIIKLLNSRLYNNIRVVDFANAYSENVGGIEAIKDNFNEEFVKIYNEIILSKEKKVNNFYIILGVSYLKEQLDDETYNLIINLFAKLQDYKNTHFIFVDVYNGIKTLILEDWYQKLIDRKSGIWLGEGYDSQVIFNTNIKQHDKKLDFAFLGLAVSKGNYEIIKYVVDMEEDDE